MEVLDSGVEDSWTLKALTKLMEPGWILWLLSLDNHDNLDHFDHFDHLDHLDHLVWSGLIYTTTFRRG